MNIVVDNPVDYTQFNWATVGSFATTTRNNKYILSGYEILTDKGYETPSSVFTAHAKQVKFSKVKASDRLFTPVFPFVARPLYLPEAVYVDIKSAYLQIANSLGNEFIWLGRQHKAFGGGTFQNEWFAKHKLLRALIYSGTSGKGQKTVWENRDLKTVTFPSSNYAPYLRFAIQAVLHSIAFKLRRHAYYWHTDGMIIPAHRLPAVESILNDIGFKYTIKYTGRCRIFGVGNYRFLDYPAKRASQHVSTSHLNLWDENTINHDFWLNTFSKGLTVPKNVVYPVI